MSQHSPTHTLVASHPIEGTPHHNVILFKAIQAAAPFADRVVILIEPETVGNDYPSLIQELDDNFSQTDRNGSVRYETGVSDSSLEIIESFLKMTGTARVYGVRKLELVHDTKAYLRYVPEHEIFTIDDISSGEIITTIQNAINSEPAVILPNRPIAEWKHTGVECSISPPSLCIGNVCHDLSRLASIESHPDELAIELRWYKSDQGQIGKAASWISSQIGLSRPDTLHFESTAEFSTAKEGLQTVVAGIGEEKL